MEMLEAGFLTPTKLCTRFHAAVLCAVVTDEIRVEFSVDWSRPLAEIINEIWKGSSRMFELYEFRHGTFAPR